MNMSDESGAGTPRGQEPATGEGGRLVLPPEPALAADSVANWLLKHPDFFAHRPDVLAAMRLPSPHEGRAISFQDRQIELLRERLRGLERKFGELIHIGRDNEAISLKMLHWVRGLLTAHSSESLPRIVTEAMRTEFVVPLVALRLWRVDPARVDPDWLDGVTPDQVDEVDRMNFAYCGPRGDRSFCAWLPGAGIDARSIALIPLRRGVEPASFGLLVLGSGDAQRFQSGMGTEFLERIAEIASAALARLVATVPES